MKYVVLTLSTYFPQDKIKQKLPRLTTLDPPSLPLSSPLLSCPPATRRALLRTSTRPNCVSDESIGPRKIGRCGGGWWRGQRQVDTDKLRACRGFGGGCCCGEGQRQGCCCHPGHRFRLKLYQRGRRQRWERRATGLGRHTR